MRTSDWSSDVCSSDLGEGQCDQRAAGQGNSPWPLRQGAQGPAAGGDLLGAEGSHQDPLGAAAYPAAATAATRSSMVAMAGSCNTSMRPVLKCTVAASTPASAWSRRSILAMHDRSEEHTSELQSLMRISYAGFCLKKKKTTKDH